MAGMQGSLLDAGAPLALGQLAPARDELGRGAWIDHQAGWVDGSDDLLDALMSDAAWRADRRQMYDREVAVPRLVAFYGERDALPHPCLEAMRAALNRHYAAELGEEFRTVGLCWYRDGRDSVAWHGDRIGRSAHHDTMVAIASVGSPRTLAFRPAGGGPTQHRYVLGHGDLAVMGGSCQRTWEHAIPKTAAAVGPRISIQFRPRGVL